MFWIYLTIFKKGFNIYAKIKQKMVCTMFIGVRFQMDQQLHQDTKH